MSPFTVKPWDDLPFTDTPISAAALKDMEQRLSDYTDSVSGGSGVSLAAEITRAEGVEATLATGIAANGTAITAANAAIALKSPLASPTFTGVPAVPTAAPGTNTTQAASTAFVTAAASGGAGIPAAISVESYIPTAANAAAAWESAIHAAQALSGGKGGRVIAGNGLSYSFSAGTVPQIQKNVPVDIDLNGCTIVLSATCPRAFDPGPGAGGAITAYDTFTGITIRGGTIDANNTVGNHHVIFGSYINSTIQSYINFDHITIRNMKTINVTTSTTSTRSNVSFFTSQNNSGEATQTKITDIVVEDCDFSGGLFGVQAAGGHGYGLLGTTVVGAGQTLSATPITLTVAATAGASASGQFQVTGVGTVSYTGIGSGTTFTGCTIASGSLTPASGARVSTMNANILVDRIRINRIRHDTNVQPPSFKSAGTVDLVSTAFGGKDIHVSNVYSANCWDVSIEVDGCERCVIDNFTSVNAFNNPFLHSCFNDGMDPNNMQNIWRDCTSYNTAMAGTEAFNAENSNGVPLGDITLENCQAKWNWAGPVSVSGSLINMTLSCRSLTITNFNAEVTGYTWTGAGAGFLFPIRINLSAGADGTVPTLRIRNMKVNVSVSQTAAGKISTTMIGLAGTAFLDIDGLNFEYASVNSGGGSLNAACVCIDFGVIAGSSLSGTVRGIRVRSITGDTTPTIVQLESSANLTVPTELTFADCDFQNTPAGGFEFVYQGTTGAGGTNMRKFIRYDRIKWRVYPRPAQGQNLTNFTLGAWTTATGNQYIGGSKAVLNFLTATGAGITAIDRSIDGGTTYYNCYTQASGAMANSVQVPVNPRDFIKVTFATTQPTTEVLYES